eukprot:ctg_69.g57
MHVVSSVPQVLLASVAALRTQVQWLEQLMEAGAPAPTAAPTSGPYRTHAAAPELPARTAGRARSRPMRAHHAAGTRGQHPARSTTVPAVDGGRAGLRGATPGDRTSRDSRAGVLSLPHRRPRRLAAGARRLFRATAAGAAGTAPALLDRDHRPAGHRDAVSATGVLVYGPAPAYYSPPERIFTGSDAEFCAQVAGCDLSEYLAYRDSDQWLWFYTPVI